MPATSQLWCYRSLARVTTCCTQMQFKLLIMTYRVIHDLPLPVLPAFSLYTFPAYTFETWVLLAVPTTGATRSLICMFYTCLVLLLRSWPSLQFLYLPASLIQDSTWVTLSRKPFLPASSLGWGPLPADPFSLLSYFSLGLCMACTVLTYVVSFTETRALWGQGPHPLICAP